MAAMTTENTFNNREPAKCQCCRVAPAEFGLVVGDPDSDDNHKYLVCANCNLFATKIIAYYESIINP